MALGARPPGVAWEVSSRVRLLHAKGEADPRG